MSVPPVGSVYALLADGSTVEIREAGVGDFDAVREMHAAMSPDNTYLRFFSMSTTAAEREARRIAREPAADHAALLACLAGELIGVASYEARGSAGEAEIAFAVADHAHHRGVATLLLEHLVSAARERGVRTFTAEVLAENSAMLQVFADAGLRARRKTADGVTELAFDLPGDDGDPAWEPYLDAVALREGRADVASLRHVLAAESVAVVGASRKPGSVGRSILRNIVTGGYVGRVYAVNPHAAELEGVPCVPSPAALPESADLAVVAVPAAAAASPVVTREALFRQAGIVATRDIGELIEAAALLASQPAPAGGRVAIVSNAGGAGVLAADACSDVGLHAAVLDGRVQDALRRLLPSGAEVTGPVDTTAAVPPDAFRRCLELVAADEGVDAILALTVPTAVGDHAPPDVLPAASCWLQDTRRR